MEWIKNHPYAAGGAIIAAIVLFMVLRGGGGGADTGGGSMDIYAAQNLAADRQQEMQFGLAAQGAALGSQIELANIAKSRDIDITDMTRQVELAKIDATQQITNLANTLSANVAIKNLETQQNIVQIGANERMETTHTVANALVQQSSFQRDVSVAAITTQGAIAQAQIAAAAAAADRTCIMGICF